MLGLEMMIYYERDCGFWLRIVAFVLQFLDNYCNYVVTIIFYLSLMKHSAIFAFNYNMLFIKLPKDGRKLGN